MYIYIVQLWELGNLYTSKRVLSLFEAKLKE